MLHFIIVHTTPVFMLLTRSPQHRFSTTTRKEQYFFSPFGFSSLFPTPPIAFSLFLHLSPVGHILEVS